MATFEENIKLQSRLRNMCFYQFFKLSITISTSYLDWQSIVQKSFGKVKPCLANSDLTGGSFMLFELILVLYL